jgi:putative hemolysin
VGEVWPQLVLVIVLVVLNAAFAGSEMALVSLRESQLQRLEAKGRRGRALAKLARDPNRFLATIQIGITLAGFLASAAAAVSLAEPLEDPLGFLGGAAGPVSIVVVTLLLSYVTLVLGELAPKRIAMQRAEGWGLVAARPLSVVAQLTRPVVWVLSRSTDIAVKLLGGDPDRHGEEVTEDELRDMVAAQPGFTEQHRTILTGAFEIAGRTLLEIVQPRRDVFVLPPEMSCHDGLLALAGSNHTRAPVAHDSNLDEFVGVVHLRDLVNGTEATVGEVTQPAPAFPETAKVLDALRTMQSGHHQMAIVINEHGGTEGIVTVEDLLEELVGEIYDETDQDILSVREEPDGARVLPGRFPVHDLKDIDVVLPDGPYSTVAGLVLDRLGFIPEQPGDTVSLDGWLLEVMAVDGRAITEVRLRVDPAGAAATGTDDEAYATGHS